MGYKFVIFRLLGFAFLIVSIVNCIGTDILNNKQNSSDAFNLDFEFDTNLKPLEWYLFSNKYGCKPEIDETKSYSGNKSLKLVCDSEGKPEMIKAFNSCLIDIVTDSISVSAYMKFDFLAENSTVDFFYQLHLEKEISEVVYIPCAKKEMNNEWENFNFNIPLSKETSSKILAFGFSLKGKGKLWIDNIEISIDGQTYIDKLKKSIKPFTANQINVLKSNLEQINSFNIQEDNSDLAALDDVVSTSKIVMLGEGTHGTREFTLLKKRIISYLVSDLDFDIIALEANMPEVKLLNEYLASNSDIEADKLEGLKFWMYRSDEFFELVKWIHSYNQKSEKKIKLTGFDMQYLNQSVKDLVSFSSMDSNLLTLVSELEKSLPSRFENNSNRNESIAIAESIKSYIIKNKNSKFFMSKNIPWGIQSCEIIIQVLKYEVKETYSKYRDEKMAENISWISKQNPSSKIIVWAHNGHVKKNENMMGEALLKLFNDTITSIAFTTGEGVYTAKAYTEFPESIMKENNLLKEPDPYSWEYGFRQTSTPAFMLSLKDIKNSFLGDDNKRLRSVGAIATPKQFYPSSLFEEFDVVIYIDKTTSISLNY